jgi:aspartate kinase
MALIVHKYGGTSMGSVERIQSVAKRVAKWVRAGHRLVVVPSAMSGETNRLLELAKQVAPGLATGPARRELDMIASTGEQVSVGLLSLALQAEGLEAVSYAGWQVPIQTDTAYTKARIERIDEAKVHADLDAGRVVVITGFQGVDPQGNITTLGRGGSDTSAVAVAAAMKADECLIFTDVDGVYTTDPRIVAEARRLKSISFEEMLEMASLGSKVLQIRSVEFAGKYRVPLRVLSSFTPWDIPIDEEARSGTLITFEEDANMEQAIVSGIAFNRDEAKISLLGVTDKPGVAHAILGPVAEANIDVDVILQNVSHDGRTDFSFTVPRNDYARAMELLKAKVLPQVGASDLIGDPRICKVSIVGIGMRSHVGVASRMFRALAAEGINIQMITTSEIKTSVVIDEKYMELAVRALHKAFDLDEAPRTNGARTAESAAR